MWLSKLKVALALEEIDQISSLLDEMPQFDTLEQMEEASYLLMQSKNLLEQQQNVTLQVLQQLKNTLDFLKSTQIEPYSTLSLKF